jgi:hypothetical protein
MVSDLLGDMEAEYATNVADRAIRSMSQQSVPPTPANFSVWFNYAMGTSSALRKTIDVLVGNRRTFDASINHELYATYTGPTSRARKLTRAFWTSRFRRPPLPSSATARSRRAGRVK